MQVPGTQVSVEDTTDGVAMVFTTTGDVAELRKRVRHKAEMHEKKHQVGTAEPGMEPGPGMGAGPGHKKMHMMAHAVPSTARMEEIEGGARINLVPTDPQRLAELRAQARERASHMASGQCPMARASQ